MKTKTKQGLLALGVVLGASYLVKRKLLAQWDKMDRTGRNDLTFESASRLVLLSAPWDLTFGLFTPGRNALFGRK